MIRYYVSAARSNTHIRGTCKTLRQLYCLTVACLHDWTQYCIFFIFLTLSNLSIAAIVLSISRLTEMLNHPGLQIFGGIVLAVIVIGVVWQIFDGDCCRRGRKRRGSRGDRRRGSQSGSGSDSDDDKRRSKNKETNCGVVSSVTLKSNNLVADSASTFAVVNVFSASLSFNPATTVIPTTTPAIFPVAADNNRGNGRELRPFGVTSAGPFTGIWNACRNVDIASATLTVQVTSLFTAPVSGGVSSFDPIIVGQIVFVPRACVTSTPGTPQVVSALAVGPTLSNVAVGTTGFNTTQLLFITPVTFKTTCSGDFEIRLAAMTNGAALNIDQVPIIIAAGFTFTAAVVVASAFTVTKCCPCVECCIVCGCNQCTCKKRRSKCNDCGCSPCECKRRKRQCNVCGCSPCECDGGSTDQCNVCSCSPCEC